jgi:Skp family chaperone for outer membrane proteins
MKKLFLLLVITASTTMFAQSSDDIAIIQDIYGKSKTDLINDYLNLPEPQATAFKEVYNNYETERKALGKKKIQLISDYAANYDTLTDENADELTKNNLKINVDQEKLFSKTYGKAKKAIGAINAAKFIQLEQYLQTTVQAEVQDAIPFIGELEKTKKK